jgi:hypothetical protein
VWWGGGDVTMAVWESGCSLLFIYGEICGGGIVVDVDGGWWWARLVGFLVFYSSSKLFAAAKQYSRQTITMSTSFDSQQSVVWCEPFCHEPFADINSQQTFHQEHSDLFHCYKTMV